MTQPRTTRRPDLQLDMIGIRLGDVLTLYDAPEETCIVIRLSPPRVVYRDQAMYLTEAANLAAGGTFNDPSGWWTLEGETLRTRRARFERYHCE